MFLVCKRRCDKARPARSAEKTRFIVFGETVCRQNRIVLMSDGMAGDVRSLLRETLTDLVQSGVPVDTVAFGI